MSINYFTYYYDIINNTTYIGRNIYELCKKYEIEINSTPRIINNKNCYSIDEESLKKFINKSNYIGNRVLILLNTDKKKIMKKQILNICNYNGNLFIEENIIKNIDISDKSKIKVDGSIYINVTENDINNLKRIYIDENIELENKKINIIPLKK